MESYLSIPNSQEPVIVTFLRQINPIQTPSHILMTHFFPTPTPKHSKINVFPGFPSKNLYGSLLFPSCHMPYQSPFPSFGNLNKFLTVQTVNITTNQTYRRSFQTARYLKLLARSTDHFNTAQVRPVARH
jgi:hypothetical protein